MEEVGLPKTTAERDRVFKELKKDTKLLGGDDFEEVYALHRKSWGISSPACILYRNLFEEHPNTDKLPEIEGDLLIAVNKDVVPERFVEYIKLHEYWEHYLRIKEGFNLLKADERDYELAPTKRKRPTHRFAILKEFKAAQKDGVLEDYMDWWRQYYEMDAERIRGMSDEELEIFSDVYDAEPREGMIGLVNSNLKIREEVYDKLTDPSEV